MDIILKICAEEHINAVTTFIDPEIMLLAENRERFSALEVEVLAPYTETAKLCFDKYEMFKYLRQHGINTPETWGSFDEAKEALNKGNLCFPVFVKPRTGSGSVGARKIYDLEALWVAFEQDPSLIVQELMTGENAFDLDADIYIDTITHKPVFLMK